MRFAACLLSFSSRCIANTPTPSTAARPAFSSATKAIVSRAPPATPRSTVCSSSPRVAAFSSPARPSRTIWKSARIVFFIIRNFSRCRSSSIPACSPRWRPSDSCSCGPSKRGDAKAAARPIASWRPCDPLKYEPVHRSFPALSHYRPVYSASNHRVDPPRLASSQNHSLFVHSACAQTATTLRKTHRTAARIACRARRRCRPAHAHVPPRSAPSLRASIAHSRVDSIHLGAVVAPPHSRNRQSNK